MHPAATGLRFLKGTGLRLALALAGLLLVNAAAAEAPADDDPIATYLQQRGLVDGPAVTPEQTLTSWQERTSELVLMALHFVDLPYRRGGTSVDHGFDCSGFTRHIFEVSLGLPLPRSADEQASARTLMKVGRDDLLPGDLVFFNTQRRQFSHVGIYVGEGRFIHAPRSGAKVRVEDMAIAYWHKRFTGARRPQASAGQMPPIIPAVAARQAALLAR